MRLICAFAASCLVALLTSCSGSSSPDVQPNAVFQTINNAVESSMTVGGANLKTTNNVSQATASDLQCDEHGQPVDGDGNSISSSEEGYAAHFFYCVMTKHTNGPDTLLGAIDQVKSFVCAIGDKLVFNGVATET